MADAIWALTGVVVGAVSTGFFNVLLQGRQFKHNKEMFQLQNRASETVKSILTEMLNHRSYTDRSFSALKTPIGGFEENELRQLLHEIGAKKTLREDGSEWWYLLSREEERKAKKKQSLSSAS